VERDPSDGSTGLNRGPQELSASPRYATPGAYFGMSVSAGYLEASVAMAAVAREVGVHALA